MILQIKYNVYKFKSYSELKFILKTHKIITYKNIMQNNINMGFDVRYIF